MEKALKVFVHATIVVLILGGVMLLNDGDLNIYSIWAVVGYVSVIYLIETKWNTINSSGDRAMTGLPLS